MGLLGFLREFLRFWRNHGIGFNDFDTMVISFEREENGEGAECVCVPEVRGEALCVSNGD